jgi:hypothetical protein
MDIKPLDYRLIGAWLTTLVISGVWSAVPLNNSISALSANRARAAEQGLAIRELERKAQQAQAAIDNNINLYDSVTLTNYVCDPQSPPGFEVAPFVKSELVNVADKNQRLIGYIEPSGTFVFLPNNCNMENL